MKRLFDLDVRTTFTLAITLEIVQPKNEALKLPSESAKRIVKEWASADGLSDPLQEYLSEDGLNVSVEALKVSVADEAVNDELFRCLKRCYKDLRDRGLRNVDYERAIVNAEKSR